MSARNNGGTTGLCTARGAGVAVLAGAHPSKLRLSTRNQLYGTSDAKDRQRRREKLSLPRDRTTGLILWVR